MKTVNNFLVFLFLGLLFPAYAQDFQSVPSNFVAFTNGGMNWGDYNNDGALDLLLNGTVENGTSATKLFKNHAGQFAEVTANLPELYGGSATWGDFDNDQDLDILICGMNAAGDGKTLLYKNNNGFFTLFNSGLPSLTTGEAIWLDYNNDNFLDILLTGDSSYNSPVTKLFRNNGSGEFIPVTTNLVPAYQSYVTAGDYDLDGDVDILQGGACDCDSVYFTRLFRNENGLFVDSGIPFPGLAYGDGVFFDYDKDGDLDVAYMGSDLSSEHFFKLYRNDNNDLFVSINTPIVGEWAGHIDVADFNNDGYPDLGVTGSLCCGDALTNLYINNGSGNFELHPGSFPEISYSQIGFADYDNDGDADFVLTGAPSSGALTTSVSLFRNQQNDNSYVINSPPTFPTGLTSEVTDEIVLLTWNPSTDNTTPTPALTYNLMVGLSPNTMEIMTPLSDLATGFKKIFGRGNCGQTTAHSFFGLPDGTYYWSVQAVDHSGLASEFAPAESFTIGTVGKENTTVRENPIIVFPNPATDLVTIETGTEWDDSELLFFDVTGRLIFGSRLDGNRRQVSISGWNPGSYFIEIKKGDKRSNHLFVKSPYGN